MTRLGRGIVLGALALALVLVVGCQQEPEPAPEPKVSPPAVKTAGVLVAGVDLSTPPFAGTDQGKQAGIDVDVASAVAERLGLKVEFVDVKPSEAATALADGTADIVLSVPLASSDLSQLNLAGSYIADAPGFFVSVEGTGSVEPTLTLSSVRSFPIATQNESEAYWLVRHQIGDEAAQGYPTLREAMQALVDGNVGVLAGDMLVGGYMAKDFPSVRFAGQAANGSPLAIAVAVENTTLGDSVRSELDALAADGVLDTIRRKWVGDLPEVTVESSEAPTSTP